MSLKNLFNKTFLFQENRSFWTDALHLLVLWSIAIAQPLYDLLGRFPEFFVAHHAGPSTLWGLVIVVSILAPLLLVAVEAIARLVFAQKIRIVIHFVLIGILAALILVPPLSRWDKIPGIIVVFIALLSGGAVAVIYQRWKIVRTFFTVLSPVILIFPVYFLFLTPVKSIVSPKIANALSDIQIKNQVPVTLIVFDEFNTMALLNEKGLIDSVRYPNFAALAKQSWWFPNAVANALQTEQSLPAILTGQKPSVTKQKVPTYTDFPFNLFTLLGSKYSINAFETSTSIYSGNMKDHPEKLQLSALISDIRVIYGVLFIPGNSKKSSIHIGSRWTGFALSEKDNLINTKSGSIFRTEQIKEITNRILPGKTNQLTFAHLLLPHIPYKFLSSGKSYSGSMFLDGNSATGDWGNSRDLVEIGYQRYLQQVGFTDKILGIILDDLKEKKLYESSLIIVTADHGVTWRPNKSRRAFLEGNIQRDLIKVPTFMKLPDQKKGRISRSLVAGIDILPTIADVLGVTIPWEYDGGSMLSDDLSKRNSIEVHKVDMTGAATFDKKDIEGFPLLGWQNVVFGSEKPLTQLTRRESHQELLGKDLKELKVRPANHSYTIEVDNTDQFRQIDLAGGFLPALLRGYVVNYTAGDRLALAFALNGKIWAASNTTRLEGHAAFFNAFFPEAAFRQGLNTLGIYMIRKDLDGNDLYLVPVPIPNQGTVMLQSEGAGKESLVLENGKKFPVIKKALTGFLDGIYLNESTIFITGWAFDMTNQTPVNSIVIFSGKEYITRTTPVIDRQDVAKALGTEKGRYSGFKVEIPVGLLTKAKIRTFGITKKGVAGEVSLTARARLQIDTLVEHRVK